MGMAVDNWTIRQSIAEADNNQHSRPGEPRVDGRSSVARTRALCMPSDDG